jgi:riboflavin synthase
VFTGIVSATGRVSEIEIRDDRMGLTIQAPYGDLAAGESVAVDGACLTVVDCGGGWFRVEAVVTTRGRTRFERLDVGDEVNLERAMAVGDRFGGHIVQGHVDGVGTVRTVETVDDAVIVDIDVPDEVAELCVPHGSITVNGVSLTVNAMTAPSVLQVSLIPFTLDNTTLGALRAGDEVHLEADIIGKYVRELLDRGQRAS